MKPGRRAWGRKIVDIERPATPVLDFRHPAPDPATSSQPAASTATQPGSAPRRLSAGKWFAVGAASLVLLTALGVYLFEWNMLRGYVSRQVSEATGRAFAINGDLSVSLSLRPRIVARDLVLGNASWARDPNMAEIGEVAFTLDAPSLLSRRIVLPHVTLSDARIALERNADGVPNWDLGERGPSSWGTPHVDGMTIDRGRLDYRDPAMKTKISVEASTIPGAAAGTSLLSVAAGGQFKGMATKVSGEVGSVLELRTPENPYPVKLRGTVGATRARIDGALLDPLRLGGEDLSFELAGADLSQLLPIIGVPLPPTPAYKLSGHLNHKGAVWAFRKFAGTVGRSDLAGDFTVDRGSDHGVTLGARFMIYRDRRKMETLRLSSLKELPDEIVNPDFLYELGEAVVVDVKPEISTLKALNSRSALLTGDYVALRK